MSLTHHQRHGRLVKLVRRTYQIDNPGSRLFPNTSGVAWQGKSAEIADGSNIRKIVLNHPRPVRFGIPEPGITGTDIDGSGGADLLGVTIVDGLPIFSAIECKTGKSRLEKNQILFRNWVLSVNGFHKVARECRVCWDKWEPIKKNGKIIYWIPVAECPSCLGYGYLLEDK